MRPEPERRVSRKDSQDWEWQPKKGDSLPKGRSEKSQDTVISLRATSGIGGSMTEACIEPGWRINDILLAAKVLQNTQSSPNYDNEAEMRRVFGLVYDVLRCETFYINEREFFLASCVEISRTIPFDFIKCRFQSDDPNLFD